MGTFVRTVAQAASRALLRTAHRALPATTVLTSMLLAANQPVQAPSTPMPLLTNALAALAAVLLANQRLSAFLVSMLPYLS